MAVCTLNYYNRDTKWITSIGYIVMSAAAIGFLLYWNIQVSVISKRIRRRTSHSVFNNYRRLQNPPSGETSYVYSCITRNREDISLDLSQRAVLPVPRHHTVPNSWYVRIMDEIQFSFRTFYFVLLYLACFLPYGVNLTLIQVWGIYIHWLSINALLCIWAASVLIPYLYIFVGKYYHRKML